MTKQLSGPALLSSQARFAVIPGLTRDPVPHDSWIADVETPDPGSSPGQALIRGRNHKTGNYEQLSGPGDRTGPGRRQNDDAKDDAVIGKAGKAVRRNVAQQPADAQPGTQKRDDQTHRKQRHIGQ